MSDNPFAFTAGEPMDGVNFEPRERRERRMEPVRQRFGVRQNFPPPQRVAPEYPLALPPLAGGREERAPRRESRMQRSNLRIDSRVIRYDTSNTLAPARRTDGGEITRRETRMEDLTF